MTQMTHIVHAFKAQALTSKAGRPYLRQELQIVQNPARPDARAVYFPNSPEEVLEPGTYSCEIWFKDTPTGIRLSFEDFQPLG